MLKGQLDTGKNSFDHRTTINGKSKCEFFTKRLSVSGEPIRFIIDSGSPLTLNPNWKFKGKTAIKPSNNKYNDVNGNDIKFVAITRAEIKTRDKTKSTVTDNRKR